MELQKLSQEEHGKATSGPGDTAVMNPKTAPILGLLLEIFILIAEALGFDRYYRPKFQWISHLARTCKACYNILSPVLYKLDVKFGSFFSLFFGAISGNLRVLNLAFDYGANLNSTTLLVWGNPGEVNVRGTQTVLHQAVQYNCPEVVTWLLNHGVHLNAASRSFGLCRCEPSDFWHRHRPVSEVSWRPLHTAICNGYLQVARLLISGGASLIVDGTYGTHTALHSAAWRGNLPVLDYLATNSLIGNIINQQDVDGNTVLHYLASLKGRRAIRRALDMLLPFGPDIEMLNNRGESPLVRACRRHNFVLAKYLLDLRANPSHNNAAQDNPLYLCVTARFNSVRTREGREESEWEELVPTIRGPALRKLTRDSLECIHALLSKGVDANIPLAENNGRSTFTCLMAACERMDLKLMELLLEGWRQQPSASRIIKILLRHGARLDATALQGDMLALSDGWFRRRVRDQAGLDFLQVADKSHISQENLMKLIKEFVQSISLYDSLDRPGFQELMKLAKKTYGVQADDIRGYLDAIIDKDDQHSLECLVSLGYIQFVMDQDDAYEIERLQNPGVLYYATETLAAKALTAEARGIGYHVISQHTVYPAGKRFTYGRTLLHLVIKTADPKPGSNCPTIQHLLERLGPDDIDIFDDFLDTPLHTAVANSSAWRPVDELKYLLEAGAYPHIRPSDKDLEEIHPEDDEEQRIAKLRYVTPFELAIRNSQYETVKLMLTTGCYALPDIPPRSKTSYVHMACKIDNSAILEELISHGADINGRERCLDPPAAMLLRGIWERKKARGPKENAVETGMKHLRLLLDFERHFGNDKNSFAVPCQVRDRLQEIVEYDGQDGYKKGIKELVKRQLGITAIEGLLVHQSAIGKVTPIVTMEE
ncbi:Ankyrin repeat-containing domain protein [Rhypophila sp. PSN 637]